MADVPAIRITAIDEASAVFGRIQSSFTSLAGALGVGLSVAGLVDFAKSTVEAAANLEKLHLATGSSVESLSKLTNQARISGVDVETVSTLLFRMSKAMEGVGQGGKLAGDALKQLGVTAKDPAQAMQDVAVALDKFADNSTKAAYTLAIFQRSGYEFNAMLHDMATSTDAVATVTAKQAAESEELEKQVRLLGVSMTTFKNIILSETVPALNSWIDGIKKAREEGLSWWDSLNVGTTYADRIVPRIAELSDKIAELRENMANAKKYNTPWFLPDLQNELDIDIKKMATLISMRDKSIMANVAGMGFTGDARDLKLQQRPSLPALAGDTTGIDKTQNALDALTKSMTEALETEQKWTEVDKLFNKFSGDTLAGLTKRQKAEFDLILNMAKRIDLDKADAAAAALQAEANKKLTEWTMKEIEEDEKLAEAQQKLIEDRLKIVTDIENEVKMMTMSNSEREKTVLMLALEAKGLDKSSAAYQDYKARIEAAVDTKQQLQEQIDFWSKIDNAAHDAFTHIYEGGKSVFDTLKQTMRSLFQELAYWLAKKWVLNLVAGSGLGSISSLAAAASSNLGGSGLLDSITKMFGLGGGGASDFAPGENPASFAGSAVSFLSTNAVPIIGTILAVGGGLIASWLKSKAGGPKQAGDYTTGGLNMTFFPGEDTAEGNAKVKELIDATTKSYDTLVKAFGGRGSAIFRQGFDTDPQGSASNRLVTMAFVGGKQVYQKVLDNLGKDSQVLADAMVLENKRALIAALKASDLPTLLGNLFKNVVPETITTDLADRLLTFSQAYLDLYDVFNANPLDDALKAVADAAGGAQTALEQQGQSLLDLLSLYDQSGQATTDLATATKAYYANVVTLIAQLEQLKTTIADMFSSSIKGYTFATLDKGGQYDYLRNEAANLQTQLMSTTDATTIDRLAKQIDQDMRDAFGLLTPEQQAAQASDFIKGANAVNAIAQQQIIAAQKAAQDSANAILTAIKTAIDQAAADLSGSAADLSDAAGDISAAAGTTPSKSLVTG